MNNSSFDNRPTVFISSTISDFKDLRSALSFYLEKSGYRVLISEETSFPINPNRSNFEICLDLIDNCQYYILLVGNRRGSWYLENETTITQEEYRRARHNFETKGNVTILPFIRDETWTLVQEYKNGNYTSDGRIQDIDFTTKFIDEITQSEVFEAAQQGMGGFPAASWATRFNRFEDITNVLSTVMRLETNRKLEILRSLALEELKHIICSCFDNYTTDGKAYPIFGPLMPIINYKSLEGCELSAREVKGLATVGFMGMSMSHLRFDSIRELLVSGELLKYDATEKRYKKPRLMTLTEVLIAEIHRVKKYFESDSDWMSKLMELSDHARRVPNDSQIVIPRDVFISLWMLGRTHRIFYNAWVLYQILNTKITDVEGYLDTLPEEFYYVPVVSGEKFGPVDLNKVQEWFAQQGATFE